MPSHSFVSRAFQRWSICANTHLWMSCLFTVPSWNTARELELYLTIVPRLDIVCNRHMLGWQAFRAQRGCVYVEGLYRIVLSVCIRRRRGLVQLQRGDWTHHAWPTQLQLSVWPNIFNSDKSKQSQGWMLKQLIALDCRPICCFSHVTGQKLQFICAVYCKQYFGQRIAHCSCRLAKPRAIGWRKEGPALIYSNSALL